MDNWVEDADGGDVLAYGTTVSTENLKLQYKIVC